MSCLWQKMISLPEVGQGPFYFKMIRTNMLLRFTDLPVELSEANFTVSYSIKINETDDS